ncbi:MAG: hypothetical protein QY331_00955 [Melioribacteraceae bacterium]|nr:MAG: hypothetical protein QY331_00955 [Melioribacteraceae bacterium]
MHPLNIIIIVLIFTTTIFPQQSLIKNYTAVDGLPVSTIYDCVQASNGNMWFASEKGLIEYDGNNWILHDSLGSEKADLHFQILRLDEKGILWAIPYDQSKKIFYLKDSEWSNLPSMGNEYKSLLSFDISYTSDERRIILVVNRTEVLISTNDSLALTRIEIEDTDIIYDVRFIDEHILVATNKGLFQHDFQGNRISKNLVNADIPVYTILNDYLNNEVYFLTKTWIGKLTGTHYEKIITNMFLNFYEEHINLPFLAKSPNNDFYFGTKFHLYQYSSVFKSIKKLDVSENFTTSGATSVYIDYEKNLWITTLRGISKIRYSPFSNHLNSSTFLENEVTSISRFPDGPLILGHNSGFTFIQGELVKRIHLNQNDFDLFSRIIKTEYNPNDDRVYFTSQRMGVGTISRNGYLDWLVIDSNIKTSYMSLFLASEQHIYFSTFSSLNKLSNDYFSEIFREHNLNIRAMDYFSENKLILATRRGVYLYNLLNGGFTQYKVADKQKDEIYALLNISENNWLIGSYGGLLVFDGKELKEFPDLKISDPIFFIEKENDYIWFGLMGGALRWNPKTGEFRRFTTKDGFAGVETNRDAFLFDDNKVYIGTENGLSIFIPEAYHAEYYEIKPKINFIGISDLDGNINNITEEIEFPHTNNDLIIMYNSPSFIDETAMTYSVLLENIDDGTTEIYNTNETSFYLRNLAPGEYKVGVSSINPNGVSSDTVYSNTIFIGSPFYIQSWFLALLVLLSVAVSYSIYNYIVRSRYSNLLEEKVKIRTSQLQESEKNIRILTQRIFTAQEEQSEKIARDLHDHIAQDMAVLKLEVDKLIESNKAEHENYSWISDKISELTIYLRDLAYFLHANSIKQTGFVNSIHALCNDFNNHMKIDVEFFTNLEESFKISEESGNNIYRFIQEALWNVRKHSDANSALVILVTQDDSLIIRIEDDGKGFEVEDILHSSNSRRMGLKSMEERILFLQGKFSIKSMIKDGTKIKAVIPLSVINQSASEANVDQASTL